MKASLRIASLALALFLFIGIGTPAAKAAGGERKQGIAYVTASSLRLRSGASSSTATLDYASKNEVVVVIDRVGPWYKVNYNLRTGYMHGDYLNFTTRENAELGYGRVNGSRVNIRSGPGTGHSIVSQAGVGDKAYTIGINNQWYKVIYGNHIGYIRSDYLDLTEVPYENADSPNKPKFFIGGKSTGVTPSASALGGGNPVVTGTQIVATARKYIGVPYVWGGNTPSGFDCSGYVKYVFNLHGITLPRTSKEQWTVGTSISRSELRPGDLVFFANTYTTGISHLGIYVGSNQFIHASSSSGVIVSSLDNTYWAPRYYGAKRIV